MYKYKIGQKVMVRKDLKRHELYYMKSGEDGCYQKNCDVINDDMMKMAGKVATISSYKYGKYGIKEMSYNWTDEMFMSVFLKVL